MAPQIGLWAILWDIFFSLFWRKKTTFSSFWVLDICIHHYQFCSFIFHVFLSSFLLSLSTVFLTLFCSVLVLFFLLFFPVSPSSEVPNYVLSSCLLSNHQPVQLLKLIGQKALPFPSVTQTPQDALTRVTSYPAEIASFASVPGSCLNTRRRDCSAQSLGFRRALTCWLARSALSVSEYCTFLRTFPSFWTHSLMKSLHRGLLWWVLLQLVQKHFCFPQTFKRECLLNSTPVWFLSSHFSCPERDICLC